MTVTRFQPHDLVPSWLLDTEPNAPGAVRGPLRFTFETDVIETPTTYIIMPYGSGGNAPIYHPPESRNLNIFAASKDVMMVAQYWSIVGVDSKLPSIVQSISRPPGAPQGKPGLVARLAQAWKALFPS